MGRVVSDQLAKVLLPYDQLGSQRFRFAAVDGLNPTTITIYDQTGIPINGINNDYTPAVDDLVLILQTETDIIVVCRIVSGG